MNEQANIPKLRFPGFEEEWESVILKNILGKCKLGGNYENIDSDVGIPLIKMGNIGRGSIVLDKIQYLPENSQFDESDILRNGDILFNTRNTLELVGKVAIWRDELPLALYNSNLLRLEFTNSVEPSNVFMNYIFNLKKSITQLRSFATGTTSVAAIYARDLNNFTLSIPILPEQKKIASFLSKVDEKLSQLKKKKELLEQYKKGMMQKIFSQEVRFKGDNGEEVQDWKERKFGDVYEFISTNSLSREYLNYEDGAIRNIHYGDIHTKFSILFDIKKEVVPFINVGIDLKKVTLEQYCRLGDLVIADASEDYSDIGKAIEIVNTGSEKILAGLHTIHARLKDNGCAIGFGGYMLKCERVRAQIMKIAQGAKVLGISATRLADIEIPIPCKEEQSKIANYLSAIDRKINHTQTQIDKTEQWKKGLLQQMFV